MNKKFVGMLAVAALMAACNQPNPRDTAANDVLRSHMDTTIKPGDDFFAYANNGWMRNNPIPGDETSWGIGEQVQKELYEKLRKINEEALAKGDKKGTGQRIGDFWFSAMDTISIEKNGIEPLREELNKISAIKTREDVMMQAALMHTYGVGVFFEEGVAQDPKHSDVEAYNMTQGGLGLPNRDYYFDMDERTVKIRNAYPAYIATMLRLSGAEAKEADTKAAAIVALEAQLEIGRAHV